MTQRFWRLTERDCVLRPGVDQVRFRTYSGDEGHWGDWTDWQTIETPWTIGEFVAAAGESLSAQEWQFRRPLHVEAGAQADDEFEPLPIDDSTMTQPGRDQARYRCYGGTWSQWLEIEGKPATLFAYMAERPSYFEWQWRRRKQAPAATQPQPPEPEQPRNVDRGVRYRRRIHQTIDGVGYGNSIVCDIADVVEAFSMPYMLAQAAKKIMLPGERGSKDRLKDLREAAWHIQRQIQIEEARAEGGEQ